MDAGGKELVDAALANVGSLPYHAVDSPFSPQNHSESLASHASPRASGSSRRYLGKVSDVSFFNSVRDLLQSNGATGRQLESYEREAAGSSDLLEDRSILELPDRLEADRFVDIYFSTIHLAYPFIRRQLFMEGYKSFWEEPRTYEEPSTFKSLLRESFGIVHWWPD